MKRTMVSCVLFTLALTAPSPAPAQEKNEAKFDDEAISDSPEPDGHVRPGLAAELEAREKALAVAEVEIEEARKDLELAEQRLQQQLEELRRLTELREEQKSEREKEALSKREERLLQLITTVEKMDPEAAAPYLDKFEMATAASILHGMKLRKAAEIISNMNASKAAALSRWFLKNGQPLPPRDPK